MYRRGQPCGIGDARAAAGYRNVIRCSTVAEIENECIIGYRERELFFNARECRPDERSASEIE